jgi:hypothetical protein
VALERQHGILEQAAQMPFGMAEIASERFDRQAQDGSFRIERPFGEMHEQMGLAGPIIADEQSEDGALELGVLEEAIDGFVDALVSHRHRLHELGRRKSLRPANQRPELVAVRANDAPNLGPRLTSWHVLEPHERPVRGGDPRQIPAEPDAGRERGNLDDRSRALCDRSADEIQPRGDHPTRGVRIVDQLAQHRVRELPAHGGSLVSESAR